MNILTTREKELFDRLAQFANANLASSAALKNIAEACFTEPKEVAEAQRVLSEMRTDTNFGSDTAKVLVAKSFALIGLVISA